MKKGCQFFIIALAIVLGCENSNQQSDSRNIKATEKFVRNIKPLGFAQTERLQKEYILIQDSGAIDIHVYDTLLLLRQLGDRDVFHVYNAQSFKGIGKIGRKGSGPNDFISPRVMHQFYIMNGDLHLLVYEARKSELRDLNITKSLENQNTEIQTVNKFHPSLSLTQYMLLASDSTYIGNQGFDAYARDRLKIVDASSNIINTVLLYPEVDGLNSINVTMQYQLYFDYIRKKPNENIFVSALSRFDQIDIFDSGLNSSISVTGPQAMKQYNLEKLKPDELSNFHYKDLRVDDNYIYALYYDQPMNEYLDKDQECQIRVFTWKGDLVKTFIVGNLVGLAVDSKNHFFYGLDMFNERVVKYQYSL